MVEVNKSLDSKVSCMKIEGIYLLLLALWLVMALIITFICLSAEVPSILMLAILCSSTTGVVLYLINASANGKAASKIASKRKMDYYICRRT